MTAPTTMIAIIIAMMPGSRYRSAAVGEVDVGPGVTPDCSPTTKAFVADAG